ncbi:MAG TPA: DUF5985 family protein [Candidatus Acidoferrum sp.]|jgi:hypothetical protein|nr:DUF5985 family protein [Candidatus Acidoferrum sp.]
MVGAIVYVIGAFTSAACATLLMRGYFRGRKKLLLWSGLCFSGLAISNLLIFVDLVLIPDVDLYGYRLASAAIAMLLLLYGLIWESD